MVNGDRGLLMLGYFIIIIGGTIKQHFFVCVCVARVNSNASSLSPVLKELQHGNLHLKYKWLHILIFLCK